MKTLMGGPYSEEESPNVTWLRHTILSAMMNCRKKFTEKHYSEGDAMLHLWSQIVYCYGDTDIEVVMYVCCYEFSIIIYLMALLFHSGENQSKATSNNKNSSRTLKERKNHGTKTDMRFKWREFELGSSEVGRLDEGENGTKELKEGHLKLPKTMRDMFVELVKHHEDKKQSIRTFGYLMMGKSLFCLSIQVNNIFNTTFL